MLKDLWLDMQKCFKDDATSGRNKSMYTIANMFFSSTYLSTNDLAIFVLSNML